MKYQKELSDRTIIQVYPDGDILLISEQGLDKADSYFSIKASVWSEYREAVEEGIRMTNAKKEESNG